MIGEIQSNTILRSSRVPLFMMGGLGVVVSIFSRELGLGQFYGVDIDWISYPFYLCFFVALLITDSLAFERKLLYILFFVAIGGIISKVMLGLTLMPLLKQLLPIVLIYSVTASVLKKVNIEKLFEWYVRAAYIVAGIGLVQFTFQTFGWFGYGEVLQMRVDSIAEEPSHFAAVILPALVYTYYKRKYWLKEFVVIFLATLLTFNLTAYVVFGIMLLLVDRKAIRLIWLLPVTALVGYYLYSSMPTFQERIDGIWYFLIYRSITDLHGTPLSFLSNAQVAWETIVKSPLFGSGLGGHEEMYYRYFGFNDFSRYEYLFGLNAKSGHSLTIRVLSELGLVGFFAYCWSLLLSLRIKKSSPYAIIALASFSHFLCKTLKLGGYFDLGTPFFLLMILFCYTLYKRELSEA